MAIFNLSMAPNCWSMTVPHGGTFGGSYLTTFAPQTCTAAIIENQSSGNVSVCLNGNTTAQNGGVFTLYGNTSVSLEPGMFNITSIDFQNTVSGSSSVNVQVIASVS